MPYRANIGPQDIMQEGSPHAPVSLIRQDSGVQGWYGIVYFEAVDTNCRF